MRSGFSLLEILLSLAIGLIIVGAIIVPTDAFTRNRHLNTAADIAATYLRTAAMRAAQSEGNMPHGVSMTNGRMTLFRGESYAGRQADGDTVWTQPGYITVAGITEVVFSKQAAVPSATGDVIISNGRKTVFITVYPTGAISRP